MFKLAQKLFVRLLFRGEFHLLLSALVLATAAITAINLFIDRIQNTLVDEASTFIAADAKISSSVPSEQQWLNQADALKLQTARYQRFNAMLFSDTGMKLANVKAVEDTYPLRGALEVRNKNASDKNIAVTKGPRPGELWLTPRLASALNIQLGDAVKVGNTKLRVSTLLMKEPDNAATSFGMAPRAMIHFSDVAATGAVQTGSRINYALLLAGDAAHIEKYKQWATPKLAAHEHAKWIDPLEGNRAVGSAVERAERFLLLAGSLSVVLCGLAIAIAAQYFARKQQTQVALLKSFGLRPSNIRDLYLFLLAALGILGSLLGTLLGWALHHIIIALLADVIPQELAGANISAMLIGCLTCLLALFAFAGPPILSLRAVAPIFILRHSAQRVLAVKTTLFFGLTAIALLIALYSKHLLVTVLMFAAIALCALTSTVAAWLILSATKKIQNLTKGVWRIGIANLQRQRSVTGLQIFVFACVGLLAVVLIQVRTELLGSWKPVLEKSPNHFVFNIFSNELDDVKQTFDDYGIDATAYYPMSRGRLIKINDIKIQDKIKNTPRQPNYQRELNLTWSSKLGSDNKIIEGQWWQGQAQVPLLVSAEQEYANGLNLNLGDTLTFSIAGTEFNAKLASIRSVQWDSMNPNFYMIFNQPMAQRFAENWITSFYLPPDKKAFLNTLTNKYPTISLIELDQTLALVKSVASRVSMAVEFILFLVLVASTLVILTSIKATIDERLKESALIRSFGASRRFVLSIILIEFSVIGFLAGMFACSGAELSLYFIQTRLFEMPYAFNFMMWLYAPVASTLIVATAGYFATASTTRVPPTQALRTLR